MASTITYGFETESKYNYDSDNIQLVEGSAKLLLQDYPNRTYESDMSDDTGWTYDSDEAEWTGTRLQQKDQLASGETVGSAFRVGFTADWNKIGSLTPTQVGTPVYSSGKVECLGAHGLYYDTNIYTSGAIKVKYTPNYTGGPSSNINLIALYNGTNSNLMALTHSPTGNTLRVTVRNNGTGVEYATVAIGSSWSPTAGTEYELELNYDAVAGDIYVMIDGALHGTLSGAGWVFVEGASRVYIGAGPLYNLADATFDDLIQYNTIQHTAPYTPDYTILEYRYAETYILSPVELGSGSPDGRIQSIQSEIEVSSGNVKYTFNDPDTGTAFWYDSTIESWTLSDRSYAQCGDLQDLIDFLPEFPFPDNDNTNFQYGVCFPDSSTQSYLDNLSVTYTHQIYPTTDPIISIANTSRFWSEELFVFWITEAWTGSDLVSYAMVVNGTKTYWDGAAWSASNGTYAQSNTSSEIATNIGTLISSRKSIGVDIFLHSDDGTSTPSMSELNFSYDAALPDPISTRLVDVNGYIYDNNGAVEGLVVQIRPYLKGFNNPSDRSGGGVFHLYDWRDLGTSLADGFFSGGVYLQTSEQYWELKIGKQRYRVAFIDKDANDLNELTLTLIED